MQQIYLEYGTFLTAVLDFLIVAAVMFGVIKMVKAINRKKEEQTSPPPPPEPSKAEKLLEEIRDLLKQKN